MAHKDGYWGSDNYYSGLKGPFSIHIDLGSNQYPKGEIRFVSVANKKAYWDRYGTIQNKQITLYLCNKNGNFAHKLGTFIVRQPDQSTPTSFSGIDAPDLMGKSLYIKATGDTDNIRSHNRITVQLDYATAQTSHTVSKVCNPNAGGTMTVSKTSAAQGDVIKLTNTPATGYRFTSYTTSPSVTVTNGQFTMPDSDITVTANFEKISYTVSKAVSPAGSGSMTLSKTSAKMGETVTLTNTPATGYQFSKYTTSPSATVSNGVLTMPASNVTVTANFTKISYAVTGAVSPAGTGSITLGRATATMGDEVTVSATPATGYRFVRFDTSPAVAIASGKFIMPASAVTVTAVFEKIAYTITRVSSPAAGGTVTTSSATATMGATVTVSQTPASGYYFTGYTTSPANLISSGQFTMPASAVTITANYKRRSTATLSKTNLAGGTTATLTISTESTAYTHKYELSFGSGMTTGQVSVAAGVTGVTISVPIEWCSQVPSAVTKSGGTLTLYTYSGSTLLGSYMISGLVYEVPASIVPSIGTPTLSIVRTIGGKTYANVGNYYVQSHSGVRVQATGSGARGSTVSSMKVAISGYSGTGYNATASGSSIDFTSGLLTVAGTATITLTATDSRGRTATRTATVTVTSYSRPAGSLSVWRVNANRVVDDMGTYAQYSKTSSYTAVGSNSMTVTLSCSQGSATNPANSGDLLPSSRKTFDMLQQYPITLTMTDQFETTTITVTLQTAKFVMCVDQGGDRIAFMKVVTKSVPSGKDSVMELPGTMQIYIGDETLEAYIRRIAGS